MKKIRVLQCESEKDKKDALMYFTKTDSFDMLIDHDSIIMAFKDFIDNPMKVDISEVTTFLAW